MKINSIKVRQKKWFNNNNICAKNRHAYRNCSFMFVRLIYVCIYDVRDEKNYTLAIMQHNKLMA